MKRILLDENIDRLLKGLFDRVQPEFRTGPVAAEGWVPLPLMQGFG